MQDKEFDDLFRSKLDELEVEPSAQVWAGIGAGLDGKKRRSIIPMLSIAASVVVLVVAAVLFIPKGETVKPGKKPEKNNIAVNRTKQPVAKPVEAPVNATKKENIQPENKVAETGYVAAVKHKNLPATATKPMEQPAAIIQKPEPLKVEEQPVLASNINMKPVDVVTPVVPGPETQLSVKQPEVNDIQTATVKPVLAAIQPASAQQTKTTAKRHGIHSFGDLVNIVVAKVDKRKDKLIEFSDSDDDESMISAVNAGIVKIKKDK